MYLFDIFFRSVITNVQDVLQTYWTEKEAY